MSRVISFLILILTIVVGITLSSNLPLAYFFDPLSLAFVIGIVFGGVAFSYGPSLAFRVFFPFGLARLAADPKQRHTYLRALRRSSHLSYGAGIVNLLIAGIIILPNMSDPSQAGSGLAVALLCPLYSVILAGFLFDGIRDAVEQHSGDQCTAILGA